MTMGQSFLDFYRNFYKGRGVRSITAVTLFQILMVAYPLTLTHNPSVKIIAVTVNAFVFLVALPAIIYSIDFHLNPQAVRAKLRRK